jgi:hypothetical protein
VKKDTRKTNSSNVTWKEIRQSASRKLVTSHARMRILKIVLRGALVMVALAALGVGGYFGTRHWQQGIERVNTVLPAQPLREVRFETDGVLTKAWLDRVLELPEGIDMMAIDIHEKKSRLEGYAQIKSVTIRRGADRLDIVVQERFPVVRMAIRNESGAVRELLVDRDGYVYEGHGYDRHEIANLLYLDGVRLHRSGAGFRRLAGIDQVDELLGLARSRFPHLARNWKVVDCRDLPLLRVRSDDIREIVFGEPERYLAQLHQLDMVIASNRRQMLGIQEQVDLSFRNQVVAR